MRFWYLPHTFNRHANLVELVTGAEQKSNVLTNLIFYLRYYLSSK